MLNRFIVGVLSAAALAGCAVPDLIREPSPVLGQADTYRFKLFLGGYDGTGQADAAIAEDLERFKATHGYASYVLVARLHNPVPWSYDYLVRFSR